MPTRRASQLTLGFSPQWVRQSAKNVPIPASYLTAAFPATSRNYLDINETNEDIFDCTGEDFLFELLVNRQASLTIDMDVDPDILAGMTAFGFAVAAAPTGGTNEVQTETVTATGGTRTLVVTRGADQQITAPIAYNANAAAIQAALEALPNVGVNDIVVSGAGPFVYTFGGAFQEQEVPLIIVNTYLLTGGTSAFVETTAGVGQTHEITRIADVTLPFMTFYVGFRGSSAQPVIFKNVVVNSIRVRSTSGQKVTATFELIGSADLQHAVGYVMPPCLDILPVRFGDCGMGVAGIDFIAQEIGREFELFYQNDVTPKFDGAGVDFTRAERADRRPSGLNMFVLGEPSPTDVPYTFAKNKTTLPSFLRIGPAGRKITYLIPQGLVRLASTPIRFGGDPAESETAIVVRPRKISGDSSTPIRATAVSSQQQAYLTPAV